MQVSSSDMDIMNKNSSETFPSPFNFDEFIPWMCLQFGSSQTVLVKRFYQEEYVKAHIRRGSSKTMKSIRSKAIASQEHVKLNQSAKLDPMVDFEKSVQINAYYNYQDYLLEVSIVKCPVNISRTVIQILCFSMPYHPTLKKLTISKGGLTATALCNIGNALSKSYLADICLDDTCVPQGNYAVLLQTSSNLKRLSLNRCELGDDKCKEIIASIDFGTSGSELRTLDLSSNKITDEAAFAFGDVLRRNRRLLHLNLSGNFITDKGALAILEALMLFSLTYDEILEMRRNRLDYNRRKIALYEDYVKELSYVRQRRETKMKSRSKCRTPTISNKVKSPVTKKNNLSKNSTPASFATSEEHSENLIRVNYSHPELEKKAREIVGEFDDPFDTNHLFIKDKYFYCIGNMFLCSLNLSYNSLSYACVEKFHNILEYQGNVKKPPSATGLLKISFDGNPLPIYCDSYVQIEMLLQNAISSIVPKGSKKRTGRSSKGPILSRSIF